VKVREMRQFTLRMPPDIRIWLELQRQKLGKRSLNATVVTLLETVRKQEKAA
jgi:hypothetical protein